MPRIIFFKFILQIRIFVVSLRCDTQKGAVTSSRRSHSREQSRLYFFQFIQLIREETEKMIDDQLKSLQKLFK